MNLQLVGKLLCVAGLAALISACVTQPQYFNDPVFARREPLPGHATYLETIKYIDDGVRYVDPAAGFFISPEGWMCFATVPDLNQTVFEAYFFKHNSCIAPVAVSHVDPYIGIEGEHLNLVCKHAYPQCVRDIVYAYRQADSVTVPIVPAIPEKAAVENLIYLMGGDVDR